MGAAATSLASQGIRIPPIDGSGRHPNVQAEPAFQKGWFEVQDEGSQLAAELADDEGITVADGFPTTVNPIVLLWALCFYHAHPELRSELESEAGVRRIQLADFPGVRNDLYRLVDRAPSIL
jgi:hypothetical protein